MIVDNTDDLDILYNPCDEAGTGNRLIDYLPHSCKGSIIFTTRTKQVAVDLAGSDVVELGKLDDDEAKDLLRTRLLPPTHGQLKDESVVGDLLHILAFALAIVHAVAYINKTSISLRTIFDSIKQMSRQPFDFLARTLKIRADIERPKILSRLYGTSPLSRSRNTTGRLWNTSRSWLVQQIPTSRH